jgi:ABC-type uncharacterized transport system substrate-binding protein
VTATATSISCTVNHSYGSSVARPKGQAEYDRQSELLREIVPQARTIAFLVNPINPVTEGDTEEMLRAARSVGQSIIVVRASNENEIDAAFAKAKPSD